MTKSQIVEVVHVTMKECIKKAKQLHISLSRTVNGIRRKKRREELLNEIDAYYFPGYKNKKS